MQLFNVVLFASAARGLALPAPTSTSTTIAAATTTITTATTTSAPVPPTRLVGRAATVPTTGPLSYFVTEDPAASSAASSAASFVTEDPAAGGVSYFVTTDRITVPGVTNAHATVPGTTIAVTRATCRQTAVPGPDGRVPPGSCGAVWKYFPSFAAAVALAIVFATLTAAHAWQAVSARKTWCGVIVMAGLWETLAFAFRAASAKDQQGLGVYLACQLFVLLAPLWVSAFAYMTLGRLVYYFAPSQTLLGLPAATLAAIFVTLDGVAFVVQLVGGAMADPSSPLHQQRLAIRIYMGGIALQQLFIVVFVGLCVAFQRDMARLGRTKWGSPGLFGTPWGPLLAVLYFALAMITVRIAYRFAEFAGGLGLDNALTTHEAYFYALEAVPMALALTAFLGVHPARIMTGPNSEMPGLFALIKGALSRKKKGEKLPNDDSADPEYNPNWQR